MDAVVEVKVIELADVIRDLRSELERARSAAAGEKMIFELGPIELEVSVELRSETGGSAKVRFYVVEAGGEGRTTAAATQRIKLTLLPSVIPEPGEARASVHLSGQEAANER